MSIPSPAQMARTNVGGPRLLTSGRPGGWNPTAVNRGWRRPSANLATGASATSNRGNTSTNSRSATTNSGSTNTNDSRHDHGKGNQDQNHNRSSYAYGWGYAYGSRYPNAYGHYSNLSSSAYGGGSADYSSSPYGEYWPDYSSSPYGYPYRRAESMSDTGASSSSEQSASQSAAPSHDGAADTGKQTSTVDQYMNLARRAFQTGDYAEAQRECQRGMRLLPDDADLREFCALCQFAQGNYQYAGGTLYEVLAAKPVWGWNTLSSFYPSVQTYTTQLRALERYVRENPKDAAGHFVLAYHYLVLEECAATIGQLREVVKLQPRDQVAPAFLAALEKLKDSKDPSAGRQLAPGR
jgi:tetratricopeptide (TPR) repeat protein